MKVLRALFLTLLFTSVSASAHDRAPDGFIVVQQTQYKLSLNGVFVYCDKPDVQKITCEDEMIRGIGSIKGETSPSSWRTAQQYVKYLLNDDFEYVDMSALNNGLALYYKNVESQNN